MRPVNLLPQSARPYEGGGKSGGAYVVVGLLAALVIGVAAYVLTVNQITTRKSDISHAQQETQAAEAKAQGLSKYGDFSQIAAARIQSVASLAAGRIDYERLLRETSRVLPAGVWLTSLDAESNDGAASASASGTSPTPSPSSSSSSSSSSGTTPSGPSVHLNGCAGSQRAVATTLVRLRAIHGSDDVQLDESGRQLLGGAAAGATGVGGASGASAGTGDCGKDYSFDILVNLTNEVTGYGDQGKKVPPSLGGGS